MKEEIKETTPFEESYPYNVLYDICKNMNMEKDNLDSDKEELLKYDIQTFINVMNTCLSDRELRCIECKYRYSMTLEETAKMFAVTRERIRQNLSHATRKLLNRIPKCRKISGTDYEFLKFDYYRLRKKYDELMDYAVRETNKGAMDILKDIKLHNIQKHISCEPIDNLELSMRSYNCLKRAGFNTIGNIIKIDEESNKSEWIYTVRNLGRKSIEEIHIKLEEKFGYTLKGWRDKE